MMKKIFILLIALIPFASNCKKDNNTDAYEQVRGIAWNSLSTQEKVTVTMDWKKAKVEISEYNTKSAYAVMFNTRDDALLGPITVYVDASTKNVLGQALRD